MRTVINCEPLTNCHQKSVLALYWLRKVMAGADPQIDHVIDSGWVPLDPEELNKCKEHLEQNGLRGLESFLRAKNEEWKTIPLYVGIIGNSGSGKSTFINTIRGLSADDHGAAGVGETETTDRATAYPHPRNEMLKFWDLPGVGTPNFPRDTYLQAIGFEKFDFFLIISAKRFTENDQWIAQQIFQNGKRFFFIRTHMSNVIQNDKKAHPKTHNPVKLMEKIREDIKKNLGSQLYHDDRVFLIDSYERQKFDFNYLEQRIIEDFPELKKEAYILSIGN